jgi:hypothetical protein
MPNTNNPYALKTKQPKNLNPSGPKITEANSNKSIGSRVSKKEADSTARWAKAERTTVSEWVMKSIRNYKKYQKQ